MRKSRFIAAALRKHPGVFCALPLLFVLSGVVGCGGGGSSLYNQSIPNPIPSPLQPFVPIPIPSSSPSNGLRFASLRSVSPNQGTAGTTVSLRTRGIDLSQYPRFKVYFQDTEATDVQLGETIDGETFVTCKAPAGTGRNHVGLVIYGEVGNELLSMSPADENQRYFTYAQ